MKELDLIEAVLLAIFLIAPIWGVMDAARIPSDAWAKAGRSKRFWIAIQIFTLYLGTVIYVAGIRRDVRFFLAPPAPDWEDVN
jgi:hypothetical protein